ncbi:unnamed protein product [Rhizoctonia solani]|uniref:Uncharacterized protein n=1 Tax=Rhizoctonia solani TaxID=456999 RepID=A0A8H3D4I6_9AGAM|nr:unnamed protein product [Rhizoctonia solani]
MAHCPEFPHEFPQQDLQRMA